MLEADLLKSFLGKPKYNNISNDETHYSFNCPKCKIENNNRFDNKYNLEVDLDNRDKRFKYKKICHCWVCGLSGSLNKVFKYYVSPKAKDTYFKICTNRLITNNNNNDIDEDVDEQTIKIELPKEFILFKHMDRNNPRHLEAYNYLIYHRKLTDEIINYYKIGFCVRGDYANKLIIPSYDKNNELNFFVTRSFIIGSKDTYQNPEFDKTKVIINESNLNWNETIYIFEGWFDLFPLPINSTLLLGKDLKVGSKLFDNIIKYKPNVVICLDLDARKKQKEITSLLRSYNINVKNINISQKDLGKIHEMSGKLGIFTLLKENFDHLNILIN
jgi:hypothetical protein